MPVFFVSIGCRSFFQNFHKRSSHAYLLRFLAAFVMHEERNRIVQDLIIFRKVGDDGLRKMRMGNAED